MGRGLDLEKFFDRVNHDLLMGRLAQYVRDTRVLKLVRAFLNAGVLEEGLVSVTEEGTPQGGRCHQRCRTSCSTPWTASWNAGVTALCATRTTATCMSEASGRDSV